ncbi:TniQ family protein [Bacillaceae bacterium CLA-AA-H227]|uniref:TniQ family protein n=1 Tax=Robertmurraya yapensis (ex Hitch et al 2024) TaxID=3133160 RepID=A0ACC6SG65_9BACI
MSNIIGRMKDTNSQISSLIRTRSVLYSLEPLGIGTPFVESLSSYMSRLSNIHNLKVSSLIREVVSPILENPSLRKEVQLGTISGGITSRYINENSIVTQDYLRAFEILTCQKNIQYTTMLNWKGLFPKNVRNKYRRWCPSCLNQMKYNSEILYEPLLWSLKDIKKCDIHETKLVETCPGCKKKLGHLHAKYQVGYCQHCGFWLGECIKHIERDTISEEERFIINNYKELIEFAPTLSWYPNKLFSSFLLNKIKNELGFSSKRELVRFLDYNYETALQWINGENIPSSQTLLRISKRLNTTLYKLIYNEHLEIAPTYKKSEGDECSKNIPLKEVEQRLKDAIDSEEIISLYRIAKDFCFRVQTAEKHFPLLCGELKTRYKIYKSKQRLDRKIEIETKLHDCLNKEIPISLISFSKEHGIPIKEAKRYYPSLCDKVIQRYKEYLFISKKNRYEKLKIELEMIIFDLHKRGIHPSKWEIAKRMKEPQYLSFDKNIIKIYEQIIDTLEY